MFEECCRQLDLVGRLKMDTGMSTELDENRRGNLRPKKLHFGKGGVRVVAVFSTPLTERAVGDLVPSGEGGSGHTAAGVLGQQLLALRGGGSWSAEGPRLVDCFH